MSEPQNDFIFSIVCEELGWIGAVFVIALFAFFIWRGIYIDVYKRQVQNILKRDLQIPVTPYL